jgi:F-type H+-transporting ATPase subunit epsilon
MATLQCDIVTPEGTLFSAEAEMVVVPGAEGELGVLPRHAPIVAQLEVGETRVRVGANEWRRFATSDGYFMVQHDHAQDEGRALVLVEGAIPADQIDLARVQAEIEDAKARIAAAAAGDEKIDRFRAERDLAHAENQLRITQGQPSH